MLKHQQQQRVINNSHSQSNAEERSNKQQPKQPHHSSREDSDFWEDERGVHPNMPPGHMAPAAVVVDRVLHLFVFPFFVLKHTKKYYLQHLIKKHTHPLRKPFCF